MPSPGTSRNPRFKKSLELYDKAVELFPFGTQLLSRSPQLGPLGQAPIYYDHAKDAHFWDVDGNEFIDTGGGVGPVCLGYCYEAVDNAVKAQIDKGVIGSVNNALEIEMAQLLCQMVPCAEMVKFSKTGGGADAVAIRLARGFTGKDVVLFCGYHGWHDWYLAANLASGDTLNDHLRPGITPKGVPAGLAGTAVPFEYNNIDSLRTALAKHAGNVACIIMEATRFSRPEPGFLEAVRELANDNDCLLIFDEVVTGFRCAKGGAQEQFGVTPDMATLGKAIANGYPLSAVVGKREVMAGQHDNFISSTFFSDTAALAAGVATLKEILTKPVIETNNATGEKIKAGLAAAAEKNQLKVRPIGEPSHFALAFDYGPDNDKLATLFMQEMVVRGVFCPMQFYIFYTFTEQDVEAIIAAADETFELIARGLQQNNIDELLKAPVRQTLFRRMV